MPKLPRYDSERALSTQAPNVQRNLDIAAQGGRDTQTLGKAAQKIAQVWQDAKDFSETLDASNSFDEGQRAIANRMQSDPEYRREQANEDMDVLYSESLQGFSNNEARMKWDVQARSATNAAKIRADGFYRQKELDHTKAQLVVAHNANLDKYLASPTDADLANQIALIQGAYDKGIVSEIFLENEKIKLESWPKLKALRVAESDPKAAMQMIENANYDPQEKKRMEKEILNVAKKVDLERELNILVRQEEGMNTIDEMMANPALSLDQKTLEINKAEHSGLIPKSFATSARRVVTSTKDVMATTSTPEFSQTIRMIYDANSRFDTSYTANKNKEYLKKLSDIKTHINNIQADGKIDRTDAQKLRQELLTATKKKQSEATQDLLHSSTYRDADEAFKSTVPSYMRDEALREYFYRTEGKTLSKEEAYVVRSQVADSLNTGNREKTLDVLDAMTEGKEISDEDVLALTGASEEDVIHTAEQNGISVEEVYTRLRLRLNNGN
jgi:hypothetical protein